MLLPSALAISAMAASRRRGRAAMVDGCLGPVLLQITLAGESLGTDGNHRRSKQQGTCTAGELVTLTEIPGTDKRDL